MPLTRRTFIRAGAIGAGALVAAGSYGAWKLRECAAADGHLSPAGRALFSAVVPALLDGAVPTTSWTAQSMEAMLDRVSETVGTLSIPARNELQQLACLLDQGAVRLLLAGTISPWAHVDPEQARRILERWRFSSSTLLVSAYQALHDLTFATWYADPEHWVAIGYPGPPDLARLTSATPS